MLCYALALLLLFALAGSLSTKRSKSNVVVQQQSDLALQITLLQTTLDTLQLRLGQTLAQSSEISERLRLAEVELTSLRLQQRVAALEERQAQLRVDIGECATRSELQRSVSVSADHGDELARRDTARQQTRVGLVELELSRWHSTLPHDCDDLPNGRAVIYPISSPTTTSLSSTTTYCADSGWTVLQRRSIPSDQATARAHGFDDYRNGFDDAQFFWLGLDALYRLTAAGLYRLRVRLQDDRGRRYTIVYSHVRLSPDPDYSLDVGRVLLQQSNISDALRSHVGARFSAPDRDRDHSSRHCAMLYAGGFWYSHCMRAGLNNGVARAFVWFDDVRMEWLRLVSSEMSVRRVAEGESAEMSTPVRDGAEEVIGSSEKGAGSGTDAQTSSYDAEQLQLSGAGQEVELDGSGSGQDLLYDGDVTPTRRTWLFIDDNGELVVPVDADT